MSHRPYYPGDMAGFPEPGVPVRVKPLVGVKNDKLADMAAHTVKANITGSSAAPVDSSLSAILDAEVGSTNGMLIVRSAGVWTSLASPSDNTQFLSGTAVPSYLVPAATGGAGWATALDMDFSAQSNQTLSPDGAYTIGGVSFTKANSANDATAMAIVNGSGLVIQPASTSNYNGTTRTAPTLYLDLPTLIPSYYFEMPLRIWMYMSADNIAASGDGGGLFIDNLGTSSTIAQSFVDRINVSNIKLLNNAAALFNSAATSSTTTANLNSTDRVVLMILPTGRWIGNQTGWFSAIGGSNAWPATSALIPFARSITSSSVATIAQNPITGLPMKCGLWAQRNGSATALSITFMKFRIDYKVT